ncbi:TPA: restriction endonuclease subunit S [Vibrio cholerae]|uniref:restriction endonuclease subunit S n=1 Tax=Vibrio cholerae TaxID=666 RepID=UPI001C301AAB
MSWSLVNLSTVCQIDMGSAPKGSTYVELDSGVPLIAGAADYGDVFPQPKKATLEPTKLCKKGDIIICVRATIGDLNWADKEYCLGRGVAGLRAHDEKLDSKYLWYFIASIEDELYRNSTGSTFPQINKKVIESLKIPLPPLETQKQIAAVLEKADQLRKDCQQMEQELNSLAQSVFIDMFGDVRSNSFNSKKVKFDDIFEINSKLVDPRLPEFENLPHIGPEHLEKRTGRILPYRTAREDALVSGKFNFQKGCVLFSKIRPNLKKVAIPEFSGLCSADMYPLEAVDGVSTREFIWGLILSDAFDDYLETLPSRANIPKINRKELAAFEFYLPDLRDQKAYSKKLAKIQEQLKQNACLYQETENNFNALMQKAFKGKLTL